MERANVDIELSGKWKLHEAPVGTEIDALWCAGTLTLMLTLYDMIKPHSHSFGFTSIWSEEGRSWTLRARLWGGIMTFWCMWHKQTNIVDSQFSPIYISEGHYLIQNHLTVVFYLITFYSLFLEHSCWASLDLPPTDRHSSLTWVTHCDWEENKTIKPLRQQVHH